jgi:hypothetical protein
MRSSLGSEYLADCATFSSNSVDVLHGKEKGLELPSATFKGVLSDVCTAQHTVAFAEQRMAQRL